MKNDFIIAIILNYYYLMPPESYILRVPRDDVERQLYIKHSLYVGIRRDWSSGTKVLFIRKSESGDDVFIGSGLIHEIVILDDLAECEKKLCLENNWYCKLVFRTITRFYPIVPIKSTPAARDNPHMLHGAIVSTANLAAIEKLVQARIIS
jgi:hypothetical protein